MKTIMEIAIVTFLFYGVFLYIANRHEQIASKKIKYSPDSEMIRGRIVVIFLSILAGGMILVLEILL